MTNTRRRRSLLALTTLCLAGLYWPHAATAQSSERVKGEEVTRVSVGNDSGVLGYFVQADAKAWSRLSADGSIVGTFTETARDEWSVYLVDVSGSTTAQINLWTMQVTQTSGGENALLGSVVEAFARVKGEEVTRVGFGSDAGLLGYFVQVDATTWNRLNNDGSLVVAFTETGRDEWSVYLVDGSGSTTAHLNLWTVQVMQNSGGANSPLGSIVEAYAAPVGAFPAPTATRTTAPSDPPAEETAEATQCPPGTILAAGSCIILAETVIRPQCPEGQKVGSGNACILEVLFHSEAGLSLAEMQTRSIQNGWVIATAEEVRAAWEGLGLDVYAFGRLADGRFAVPVQSDHSNVQRGANIGIDGGNQGFFYVPASAVARSQEGPAPPPSVQGPPVEGVIRLPSYSTAPTPETIAGYYADHGISLTFGNEDIQTFRRLEATYKDGIGNIIQDKWGDSNYQPVLDAALKGYIKEKYPYLYRDSSFMYDFVKSQIQNRSPECEACKVARYEFIGFFVPEYLKMLRTGSNPALRRQFAEYAGYNLARASRRTLDDWAYYSRRGTANLNEPYIPGEHFGNGPTLIDPADIENVPYKPNTLSIFVEADPLPGKSVADFKECCMGDSPFYFTPEQEEMLLAFTMPLTAQANPDLDGLNVELQDIPDYLYRNLSEEANALNIVASVGAGLGTGAGIGATALFGSYAAYAVAAAIKLAPSLTITEVVSGQVIEKTVGIFSKQLGKHALGTALGSAIGPILAGVAVFAAGFQNTGAKAIELAIFEDNLKRDCYYKPRQEDWNLMTAEEKVVNFTYLFKMLVLDAPGLTVTAPQTKANSSEQKAIERAAVDWGRQHHPARAAVYEQVAATMDLRYPTCAPGYALGRSDMCYLSVKFHSQAGLTLQQAKDVATANHWILADPDHVQAAWSELGLDVYAFGMMSDGRFAVPVQRDHSNFNAGANIGAVGGNQGFFHREVHRFLREAGTAPTDAGLQTCPVDREFIGGLCWERCPEGFTSNSLYCIRN